MTVLHKILLKSILLYQTAFQLVNTCSTNEVEYMLCMIDIQFVILSFCKNANWIIVTEYKEYKLQIYFTLDISFQQNYSLLECNTW